MPSEAPAFAAWRARIEDLLDRVLPAVDTAPARLRAAMRHAVLGGGKRMRPLLVYATGTAFGATLAQLDSAAAAVESIHAYSLIHDDLPAMDNDDLRRGRPTVHIAFDEATAILAGDALQCLAFEVLARAELTPDIRIALIQILTEASGDAGMAGGQALDLAAIGSNLDMAELAGIHRRKTGALIHAAVRMGATVAGVDNGTLARLDRFADALGLAFQIRDDILDVEGDPRALGKTRGKDAGQNKPTYVSVLGRTGAQAELQRQHSLLEEALAPFGAGVNALRALGTLAIARDH